jgi:hypothetical protein
MKVLTPKEFRKTFKEFKREHERHWIKVAKMFKFIKEFKRYKDFGNPNFDDFIENFLVYEENNTRRYIKALEYIEKYHSEILEETYLDYIPPYEYVEYAYKKNITEKQRKEIDEYIFRGVSKKHILEKLNKYENENSATGEKVEQISKKIVYLSKKIKEYINELLEIYPKHNYHYEKLQNLTVPTKNWIDEFISKISKIMYP